VGKERHNISYVEDEDEVEDDNPTCVAEWVDTSKDKPISLKVHLGHCVGFGGLMTNN
jgi:hypothetical protein